MRRCSCFVTHRFLVLGPVQVFDLHGRQVRIGEHKVRSLLAILLANANTPVSTGALVDALWGDQPPPSAAANLQTYVWKLRHWLGRNELERDSGGYRLMVAPDDVDATRCGDLAQLGRRQLDDGAPGAAVATLCDAAALCRGEPFAGANEVTNEPYVLRLREQCRTLRENLVEARLALGQHATVVSDLVALTTEAPYRERQWAQLMLALYRCGRRAEALAAYQRIHRVLSTELGIEPGSQLRDLQSAILLE